jgi:hypothetical protein
MTPTRSGRKSKPAREGDDGPAELFRLLGEARRCLEDTDLPGANAALRRANAEAASLVGVAPGARTTGKESEDRG